MPKGVLEPTMLEIVIVGAGPYGLSLGAYFHSYGIPFRIFGTPMKSWREHMPKGMMLKSDGFASNLYDPKNQFTLKQYCADNKIPYTDDQTPVHLETFSSYGVAFQERMVPELEDRQLERLERIPDGFLLTLDNGERVKARRVVLAVGITHFGYVPKNLAHLPEEFVSHSYRHHYLEPFRGRSVVILGAGASSIGLAGLLQEIGARPELVARPAKLKWQGMPTPGKKRPLWQRIRHPKSGLGPGMRSRFCANFPNLFHYLPERLRIEIVERHLGPSGHWFSRAKVEDALPMHLGCELETATLEGGMVRLKVRMADGTTRDVLTDHVIAGTGYRVETHRLKFLSEDILANLRTAKGSPKLSSTLESSVPGLYFVGLAAAYSFGPVMRFAFGAEFAAVTITRALWKAMAESRSTVQAASLAVTTTK
jgi:cation diffusion facilitator CzcD-associated flavoprotein CzcO